ncbi:unnamed protein product [Sphenostylis stenocarpa]|uniref:Uncharacterized protein n=1 Tax=Sphenostylis stenocarpa TaxID=92480 RepID=A0AA86W4D4_9FABA|nr:unnamed protein product [Sphenostylis stenocarpa]
MGTKEISVGETIQWHVINGTDLHLYHASESDNCELKLGIPLAVPFSSSTQTPALLHTPSYFINNLATQHSSRPETHDQNNSQNKKHSLSLMAENEGNAPQNSDDVDVDDDACVRGHYAMNENAKDSS